MYSLGSSRSSAHPSVISRWSFCAAKIWLYDLQGWVARTWHWWDSSSSNCCPNFLKCCRLVESWLRGRHLRPSDSCWEDWRVGRRFSACHPNHHLVLLLSSADSFEACSCFYCVLGQAARSPASSAKLLSFWALLACAHRCLGFAD